MRVKLIILILLIPGCSLAQSLQAEKNIRAGNELYKQQLFDNAALQYSKAIETEPNNDKAKFNLANTLYKQNKQDEAVRMFTDVAVNTGESNLKAKAYYNKGAVLSQQKKLEESIEAYKAALRLNCDDKEARENLQKALLELKNKKQPPQKEEKDKKKKQQEQQQKQPQSSLSQKEAEQRLKLLAQKEKEVQQRVQKDKVKSGSSQAKDW